MNIKTTLLFLSLIPSYLVSIELIKGDPNAPEVQTFSFGINKTILGGHGSFFVGANENLTENQEYALSGLARGANVFAPLMPATIQLDATPGVENPLLGRRIIALTTLETEDGLSFKDLPVVVADNDQRKVYLFENTTHFNNMVILSSQPVHDATGAISSGIIDLATEINNYIFAAVKPADGEFGDPNSGIALLIRGVREGSQSDGNKISLRVFGEISALTGLPEAEKALRIDTSTPEFAINSPIQSIQPNTIALHWDISLKHLFVGLQTTANTDATDGTRAIGIVQFKEEGGIEIKPIIPESAFTSGSTTGIIGAIGANQQVSIHKFKTMYTSTALNYLIVLGNVGSPDSTIQSVFALPLVNAGDQIGTIAQKDAQPVNVFRETQVPRIIARTITQPATTPDQMTQSTDSAAQVGGGILTAGPIRDIIVRDDTVYAYVADGENGIYSSQALFDQSGKIIAWTGWQRAVATTDNIFAAALNSLEGNFILASGESADTINTIQKTTWSNGSKTGLQPLSTILDETFDPTEGGIQGMQEFLPFEPGIQNIALLTAGGNDAILIAQTGIQNNNGIIIPTAGEEFNQLQEFSDGTITENVSAKTVIISGGALNTIGPVTAFALARNATNAWLFAGGSQGLAVLTNEDGSGWNPTTQLTNNLIGLQAGMRFIPIGNYSFVKKLVYDGDFLFVITNAKIDRINLNTSDFSNNNLDAITIASVGNNNVSIYGGFLDGIFSQAFGLIATTDGLFRIGNNKDVRTITNETDARWTRVEIPENAGAPILLYPATQTNRAQDITKNNGGNLFVLTANAGLDQSRINRFFIQPLESNDVVNSTTIQPFDDLFVENIPSFLLSFGEYRSNFATDGGLYFSLRNQRADFSPLAFITPSFPVPRVGVANVGDRSLPVMINFQQGSELVIFHKIKRQEVGLLREILIRRYLSKIKKN